MTDKEKGYVQTKENAHWVLQSPEFSDWECCLFGGDQTTGITWRPTVQATPNWFWRKMQYLFFGNKWKKVSE